MGQKGDRFEGLVEKATGTVRRLLLLGIEFDDVAS